LYAKYIAADPRHVEGRQLLFYAGDDAAAKAVFHGVADGIGFASVDAGPLREGGLLMQVGGGLLSALHALKQD
jgi:predicted dinucleotide-binding enzyme